MVSMLLTICNQTIIWKKKFIPLYMIHWFRFFSSNFYYYKYQINWAHKSNICIKIFVFFSSSKRVCQKKTVVITAKSPYEYDTHDIKFIVLLVVFSLLLSLFGNCKRKMVEKMAMPEFWNHMGSKFILVINSIHTQTHTFSYVPLNAILKRRPLLSAYIVNFNFHLIFFLRLLCQFIFLVLSILCIEFEAVPLFVWCMCGVCVQCTCAYTYAEHIFRTFSFSCYVDIEITQNQIAWLANRPILSAILSLTETK